MIVITGTSDGLGKSIAFDSAKEKVELIIIGGKEKKLINVKKEINTLGNQCKYFICDVSNDNQVKKTTKLIIKKYFDPIYNQGLVLK